MTKHLDYLVANFIFFLEQCPMGIQSVIPNALHGLKYIFQLRDGAGRFYST
jgi:hypothetical protein